MVWSAFPFVRIVFALMVGILLYKSFQLDAFICSMLSVFLSISYTILYFAFKPSQRRKYHFLFGLVSLSAIACFGVALTHQKTEILQSSHFANLSDSLAYYEAVLDEEVQEKTKGYKMEVVIKRIFIKGKWQEASGRNLLYIKKIEDNTLAKNLKYGDKIVVRAAPQLTLPPPNPKAFDFKQYLAYQQIYHQQFVLPSQVKVIGNEPPNYILKLAIELRQKADKALATYIDSKEEYAIVTALVIGIKDHLDNTIRNTYSNTGAMHVLAVSGLHVGILLAILERIFSWVKNKGRHGKWIFLTIILLGLWFYAFITGLSPSVLRAVIMFSLVALAKTIQRNSSIYNTIAFSALLILCYDPYLLLSVSFQLSYLALLGIVYFHPKIYGLFRLEDKFPTLSKWFYKPLDFAWSITCVSIAAQIGTFPLGLYYFHQFPVYFPLSNLVVIPAAAWIFSFGLIIIFTGICLSFVPFISQFFGILAKWSVWLQNFLLFVIEDLPKSVINGIDIHFWETVLIYSVILLLSLFFAFQKFRYLAYAAALVLALSVGQFIEFSEQKKQSTFYVFDSGKKLNFNILEANQNMMFADSAMLADDYIVRSQFYNYWAYRGIANINYLNMANESTKYSDSLAMQKTKNYHLLAYKEKKILWLWARTKEPLPEADYLLISKNAVRDLEKFDHTKFKEIILDASNYRNTSMKLEMQAQKLGIKLHNIHSKGAYEEAF